MAMWIGVLANSAMSLHKAVGVVVLVLSLTNFSPAQAESENAQLARIIGKADAAYGEYLAGQCVTCHHSKGADKGIPSIVGLPDVYFVQTMLEYKSASEERTNPAMVNVARNLTEEELGSLAKYFSQQKAE